MPLLVRQKGGFQRESSLMAQGPEAMDPCQKAQDALGAAKDRLDKHGAYCSPDRSCRPCGMPMSTTTCKD